MAGNRILTDHEEIRAWAAARSGFPAIVDVSPQAGTQPMLRIVFGQRAYQDFDRPERPVNAGGFELVEWDEWFKVFDENRLAIEVGPEIPGQLDSTHEFVGRDDRSG